MRTNTKRTATVTMKMQTWTWALTQKVVPVSCLLFPKPSLSRLRWHYSAKMGRKTWALQTWKYNSCPTLPIRSQDHYPAPWGWHTGRSCQPEDGPSPENHNLWVDWNRPIEARPFVWWGGEHSWLASIKTKLGFAQIRWFPLFADFKEGNPSHSFQILRTFRPAALPTPRPVYGPRAVGAMKWIWWKEDWRRWKYWWWRQWKPEREEKSLESKPPFVIPVSLISGTIRNNPTRVWVESLWFL